MNNQLTLTPIAKYTLDTLINDIKNGDESNVTALWNTILPKFNIVLDNGYSIKAEHPFKDESGQQYRADIVVINILKNKKIILVIECKSINHDTDVGWDMALTQLSNYLNTLNCNNGIIAVGNKFRFVKKNGNYINFNNMSEYSWSSDSNFINTIYNKINEILISQD